MYLAYLRCSAVYPKFKKANWLHYFLISFRIIELLGIVVVNIIQNKLCNGSVAEGTKCEHLAIAWTFRDAASPLFRFYYITCEAVFYVTLFKTLKGMSDGKNIRLVQYRRLQTTLFTVDLILLSFMSIYRIIGIFDKTLPTYVYYELFSSTLTIFNLTEFGLNIRTLFHTVTDKNSSDPDSNSPSKMEMGSVNRGQSQLGGPTSSTVTHGDRKVSLPSKHTSTSPLTSFAAETGFNSDYDLSSSTTAVSSTHPQNYRDHSFQDEEYDAYFPFTPLNEATTNSVPSSPPLTGKGVRRVSGSNSISLPSRAFISSERSTRRQTNETL
ncbi:hypothetical protein BGX27_010141 [Mortierella sp. AM989]|nr:hypothetical protein BGX27_010141 [Mortierella sp. AM989]